MCYWCDSVTVCDSWSFRDLFSVIKENRLIGCGSHNLLFKIKYLPQRILLGLLYISYKQLCGSEEVSVKGSIFILIITFN